MAHPYTLEGKVALITGGSRGIDLGIAQEYVQLGAKVAITGQDPENLAAAKSKLGEQCRTYASDVTAKAEHATLVRQIDMERTIHLCGGRCNGRHGPLTPIPASADSARHRGHASSRSS